MNNADIDQMPMEVQAIAQVTMEKMEQSLEKSALRDFVVHFAVEQASLLQYHLLLDETGFSPDEVVVLYAALHIPLQGICLFSVSKNGHDTFSTSPCSEATIEALSGLEQVNYSLSRSTV